MIRLLILDDDRHFCQQLARRLRNEPYPQFVVETATTIEQAYQVVSQISTPFDIFLIDLQLGESLDGIEVMKLLHQVSPSTDTVIIKGGFNPNTALRAYEAGASRCLFTQSAIGEVVVVLRSIYEKRRTQNEREWLSILNQVAEETLRHHRMQDVAQAIVKGAIQLGFERARLWLLNEDEKILMGLSQEGTKGLGDFTTVQMPIAQSIYSQRSLSHRDPSFFHGLKEGQSYLSDQYAQEGFESPTGEWVNISLWASNRCLGMLTLDHANHPIILRPAQRQLLNLLGKQVSAALEKALTFEEEQHKREEIETLNQELDMLHRASETILKLAEENEEWMWHFTLTAATANYGVGFNRAFLFLRSEDGQHLEWKLGIGHFDSASAERDWLEDQKMGLDLASYLSQLRADTLNRSPLEVESQCQEWIFSLEEAGLAFNYVLNDAGHPRHVLSASDARHQMPRQFVERFGITDYALSPLRTTDHVSGVLVVDNLFTQEPIRDLSLDYLDTFIDQAALTYENLKQQRLRDRLIDLNYSVLANRDQQPLQDILFEICQEAQVVTKADCVVIYPFTTTQAPYEYDLESIASVGLRTTLKPNRKPRQKGITGHILRGSQRVVENVSQHPRHFDGQKLADHSFLKREEIEGFIGLRIHDVNSKEIYGLLYLNYRTPQTFTKQQKRYARSFASMAAVAIRNAHIYQTQKVLRQNVEAGRQELRSLQFVSQEALTPQADEALVIKMLLEAADQLLKVPDAQLQVVLRDWQQRNGATGEAQEIRRHYYLDESGQLVWQEEQDIYSGIIGEVLREGKVQLVEDVWQTKWEKHYRDSNIRSKVTVLIRSDAEIIGCLKATSSRPAMFTTVDQQMLDRLVGVGTLALDNVRRQKHLYDVFRATRAVTSPLNLEPTLKAITNALFDTAPSLSALLIWYKDAEDNRLKLGVCYGIRDEAALQKMMDEEMDVVSQVMDVDPEQGIWANSPAEMFDSSLMEREGFKSGAAFPLFANNEKVGAMFLFYRSAHKLTGEQKGIFPILVASVSASLLDASRLEQVRRERRRFEAAASITEKVGTSIDLNDTLEKVMSVLQELFPDTNISVLTYDEEEQALSFTNNSQAFYQIDNPSVFNQDQTSTNSPNLTSSERFFWLQLNGPSIASRVARTSMTSKKVEVENIGDVRQDSDFLPAIRSTRSEIAISLMSGENQLLGVMVLESPKTNFFSKEDEALFLHVGRKISLAMERVYQSTKLQFQTTVAAATSWAAEIAHDLNSEIGLIRNVLSWLQEEDGLSQTVQGYLEMIEESLSHLDSPLTSVKAFQSERPKSVLVDDWIKETVKSLIEEKSHDAQTKVAFELDCEALTTSVNPTGLRSAMRYIIHNALDEIRKQTSSCLIIRSRILDKTNKIEIQIEDSGSGIDDAIRQTLFQKPSSTKGEKGHGFGLLFARHLIEQMGGSLSLIQSTALSGACFAFILPLTSQVGEENGD